MFVVVYHVAGVGELPLLREGSPSHTRGLFINGYTRAISKPPKLTTVTQERFEFTCSCNFASLCSQRSAMAAPHANRVATETRVHARFLRAVCRGIL